MKKLLMAILTAGLAVGAFADYEEGSLKPCVKQTFEDGTVGSAYTFSALEAPYWVNIADKNTVKDEAPAPEKGKYLHLDTDGETSFRAFDTPAQWGAGTTNYVKMGSALWVDSLVKFTASTEAPTLDDGAKFALWMKEDDSGETSTYELHVLCGTQDEFGAITAGDIVLDTTAVGTLSPTNWYHLTVRPEWDKTAAKGFFTIKLGGNEVAAVSGQTIVADPSTWSADSQTLITAGKLFPSRVNNDDSAKLVAVGFNGTGDIDDFTITNVDPSYIPTTGVELDITAKTIKVGEKFTLTATVLPAEATTKTVEWVSDDEDVATVDDGVVTAVAEGTTTITVYAAEEGEATCTVTVEAGGSITVVVPTDPSGNWTAAAEPASAAEGDEVTMTWTAAEGKLFANGEPTISITGDLKADGTLDATYPTAAELTTAVAQAKIGDKKYLTLAAALNAAEKDNTVTLLANITTSDAAAFTINKDITLDFDAYTVTKTVANHYTFDIANGATVVFEGKLGGVTQTASNLNPTSPASMIRNKGNLTINGGVYTSDFCIIKNDEDPGAGTLTVNGGTFSVVGTEGGYTGFQSALMNWSTATITGGTWNGAINTRSSDANAVSKAATTEITVELEGSEELKYVLSVGYEGDTTCENLPKIKGIALENVELKKLSTITDTLKLVQSDDYVTVAKVTLATLTITQVDNCSIVVSNATDEVSTGAKFDVDDETELTVYRTPAAGYELDGYDATETITMTEDQNVTAAVKAVITVVVPTDPSGNWTAAAEPASAAEGTEVTITWTAAEGTFFANGESTITRTGALKANGTLDVTYPTAEELTTSTAEAKIDDVSYPTLLAAFEAAEDGDTITLAKDVTFAPTSMYTIPVNNLTLDLKEFNLTGNGGKTFEVIDDKQFTIDAIDSTITGVRINVGKAGNNNGTLTINGGDWTIDNNTVVHVNGECTDSDVRIEGSKITSVGDNGIQLNGSGEFLLNNATITGATAVYAKGGTIKIENGTFTGNGTKKSYVESKSGSNATGDAIVFDKTSADSGYANNLNVTITGGEFISVNAEPVASYAMTGETPIAKFISGGTFNKKPADALIADGYKAYQDGDMWTVEEIELVTLTITQVDNCSIVVSNATDEVATDTKFDVKDETELTVYRTPAAGYELDGYAATETITMTEDKNVTAAVAVATAKAKVVVLDSGATAKFVYDMVNYGTEGSDWYLVTKSDDWNWNLCWTCTNVVFDSTFADYRPTTCASWFYFFGALESVQGIENLNTSEVTSMKWMFRSCGSLKAIDVSGFVTTNVTDMGNMFSDSAFTTLDVSSFDTSKVENMDEMFGCLKNLTTITVSDKFVTTAVTSSTDMFKNSKMLVGGKGTVYDATKVDATYARIDGGTAAPGYFTSNVPASDPVEPGNDGTAITDNGDGTVTIQENETNPGQASIKVNDADTVIKVTSTINKIILSTGSETPAAGKIVVLSGNGTDITAYCKMTQTDNVFDVSLDETKVTPEAKEPTTGTIADGKVSTAAIAGLEYSLVRTAELGVKGTSVVTARAEGDTVSLEDPMTGGKPTQAFYTIEVTK